MTSYQLCNFFCFLSSDTKFEELQVRVSFLCWTGTAASSMPTMSLVASLRGSLVQQQRLFLIRSIVVRNGVCVSRTTAYHVVRVLLTQQGTELIFFGSLFDIVFLGILARYLPSTRLCVSTADVSLYLTVAASELVASTHPTKKKGFQLHR